MGKIEVTDYISELRSEYRQGFKNGYAKAWEDIQKIIRQSAIEASIQLTTKKEWHK